MKKITAIVLALVMVFAFVGSASALTNREPIDIPDATSSVPAIALDLQIISTIIGLPAAGSIINWATFNAENAAYLEGQVVYFNAQITADGYYAYYTGAGAPAAGSTAGKQIWDTIDAYGLSLVIESAGMNFSLATVTLAPSIKSTVPTGFELIQAMSDTTAANVTRTVGSIKILITDGVAMADLNFYKLNFLFDAIVTAKNPVVKATLVAGPGLTAFPVVPTVTPIPVYGAATAATANAPFATYFTVAKTAAGVYVVDYASEIAAVTTAAATITTATVTGVTFTLKANGTLDTLRVTLAGTPTTTYNVALLSAQAGITQRWGFETADIVGNGTQILTAAEIGALNLLINAIFTQFGFSYDLNGAVIDADFIAPANFVLTDSVTVKTATATIDVDDGDEVPVTGDVASTFGFVMIAVAIIATASLAIVAKKAR